MKDWTPQVALIGRPNVGKSTLFNRLGESASAIVEDMPGVTRDRQYGFCDWNGLRFEIVDTGGFEPRTDDQILAGMRRQSEMAIEEADFVIFMADGREGIMPQDHEIFQRLRRIEKPFVVAINKLDSRAMEAMTADFYALGIEEIFAISAIHGTGVGDLLDVVVERLRGLEPESLPSDSGVDVDLFDVEEDGSDFGEDLEEDNSDVAHRPRIAVLGKPNAGKSTLINRILGEERLLALPIPGTTRDAIDVEVTFNDKPYLLIDTAGIRRKKYVKERLEREMVHRSVDALGRCDVALFMVDATAGISEQDAKIVGMAHNRGRAIVVVVNKWDLMEHSPQATKEFEADLRYKLRFLHYAPVLFCSAQTGLRISKLFATIDRLYENYRRRVPTADLNKFFEEMLKYHPPPVHRGKPIKFYYITQARIAPPIFVISANYPDAAHVTYQRFIINSIRAEFGFEGVHVRLRFKKRGGDRKKK